MLTHLILNYEFGCEQKYNFESHSLWKFQRMILQRID